VGEKDTTPVYVDADRLYQYGKGLKDRGQQLIFGSGKASEMNLRPGSTPSAQTVRKNFEAGRDSIVSSLKNFGQMLMDHGDAVMYCAKNYQYGEDDVTNIVEVLGPVVKAYPDAAGFIPPDAGTTPPPDTKGPPSTGTSN
jgi:hypothetical protein